MIPSVVTGRQEDLVLRPLGLLGAAAGHHLGMGFRLEMAGLPPHHSQDSGGDVSVPQVNCLPDIPSTSLSGNVGALNRSLTSS